MEVASRETLSYANSVTVNDCVYIRQSLAWTVIEYSIEKDAYRNLVGDYGVGSIFFMPNDFGFRSISDERALSIAR